MRIVCMVSPRRLAPTMVGLTLTMCVLVHGEHSGLCVTLTIESAPSSGHAGGCMPRHATRRHARDDFKGWRHQRRYQYPSSARAAKRRLWWWGRPPSSRSRPRRPRPLARRLRTPPCPRADAAVRCHSTTVERNTHKEAVDKQLRLRHSALFFSIPLLFFFSFFLSFHTLFPFFFLLLLPSFFLLFSPSFFLSAA